MNFILFFLLLKTTLIVSLNIYKEDLLLIDYQKISNTNRTVLTSESKNIAPCSCDITPNTCDKYCCCDIDCSDKLVSEWIDSSENLCLNVNNDDFYSTFSCKKDDSILKYNQKNSIFKYLSPLNNLLCIYYDNSGIKGRFFKNGNSLDQATLISVYQSYLNKKEKYNYISLDTGVNFGIDLSGYSVNDYIRIRKKNQTNYENEGKIYFPGPNLNGRCEKNTPLKFLNNIKNTCGYVFNTLDSCGSINWRNNEYINLLYMSFPSSSSGFLNVILNSIYIKDSVTGEIYQSEVNSTLINTVLVRNSTSNDNCICDNFPIEFHYTFLLNSDLNIISSVLLDLVLLKNIKGDCSSRKIINQKFEILFSTTANPLKRSGFPGYLFNKNLLIAKNSTISNVDYLQISNNGFSISGKDSLGRCVFITSSNSSSENNKSITYNQNDDINKILYDRNNEYSCIINLKNQTEFINFCNNSNLFTYEIYNQVSQIDYIGKYGSSDVVFINDWIRINNSLNLNSTYDNKTNICEYPSSLNLNILTTKAGNVESPQNYLIGASFEVHKTKTIFNLDIGEDEVYKEKNIQLKFRVNFIHLKEEDFNINRSSSKESLGLSLPFKSSPFVSN